MKCSVGFITVVLVVFLTSVAAYAQDAPATTKSVGFGLKSGLTTNGTEGSILVPIELGALRLEPSFGAGRVTLDDESVTLLNVGMSVQGLFSLSKNARGYAGGLIGYNRQLTESDLQLGNQILNQNRKINFFQVGPQLGIEVRVVEGLYVGIEQQFLYLSYVEDYQDNDFDREYSALTTRSLLALRVMF